MHFNRLENFQRLQLQRLSARETVELLRDVFKSEILADKLGAKIGYKSDGVPSSSSRCSARCARDGCSPNSPTARTCRRR